MTEPSPYPDFPFPLPPVRRPPDRTEPTPVPLVGFGGGIVRDGLAAQRRILVSGPLDGAAITSVAAQLMAFDGESSRDVEILINSPGGPITEIFPVLDVFDLMRAEVHVTAIGSVTGTAVGLVAAGTGERRAAPHARFSLHLDTPQSIHGSAEEIAHHAEQLSQQRVRYLAALAAATGQDEGVLAAASDRGRGYSAEEALAMGIVDTVARSPGRDHSSSRR